jgi:hypothetical protein
MATLVGVLRIYGWYIAILVSVGLLLAAALWLRGSVRRWRESRVQPGLGRPAHRGR